MALSSLNKLNRMYEVFADQDNGKLSRGEVDALAGFYKGLAPRSQASVRDRMVEIYRDSAFTQGQKAFFRNSLEQVGFTTEQLEGIVGHGPEAFARLPADEQFERLQQLGGDWGDGHTEALRARDLPRGAATQIAKGLAAFERDYKAERRGDGVDYDFHNTNYSAIYLEEGPDGKGKGLVGYQVEQGIYTGDHDIDEMLYFNRKGQLVGNEYHGE